MLDLVLLASAAVAAAAAAAAAVSRVRGVLVSGRPAAINGVLVRSRPTANAAAAINKVVLNLLLRGHNVCFAHF